MATPSEPARDFQNGVIGEPVAARGRSSRASPDLEEELRRAEEDFDRGDYIELTPEQLDRCVATGKSPWADESRG